MRKRLARSLFFFPLIFMVFLSDTTRTEIAQSYKVLNPELGIVYVSPSVRWDSEQWDLMFRDPAPPAGWAMMAVGKETCNDIPSSWLNHAKQKGYSLALLVDSKLTPQEIEKAVRCSSKLGFKRVIVDEYLTYNLLIGRPVCAAISEVRSLADRIKRNYPQVQFGIDENWHIWMERLGAGQSDACGSYPYFKVDYAGLSVFTKYGNPSGQVCGHPTAYEMEEQLIDLGSVARDYSRSGKAFVWQLNQNWYPGGEPTLQFFRQMKAVYGWDRFFLYGPTKNWAYTARGKPERCPGAPNEWYLPARNYLIRISEGQKATINLNAPATAALNSTVNLSGSIRTDRGVAVRGIELQMIPPVGTLQNFAAQVKAPSNAFVAIAGVRINSQLPDAIKSAGQFILQRASLSETGRTNNLIPNGDFNDGLRNWVVIANAPVSVVNDASGKSLTADCARNQSVSITSLPFPVVPGRLYNMSFDARVLKQARNSGYFFVAWLNPGEVRRDRLFMKFPDRQTIAVTGSRSNGVFSFQWQPNQPGVYSLFSFYPGIRAIQPAIARANISVQ